MCCVQCTVLNLDSEDIIEDSEDTAHLIEDGEDDGGDLEAEDQDDEEAVGCQQDPALLDTAL